MIKALLVHIILVCFVSTGMMGTSSLAREYALPNPGEMIHLSPPFNPPVLKGIKVYPDNPLKFEFILDRGDSPSFFKEGVGGSLKQEATKLIKYFLASLTTPENDLWVNLSPYEKNRIIPASFGLTEMGRDVLAEDYILKQITASLIYPEDEVGRMFWKRIYEQAAKRYGTTDVPVNTFNKVWIVPQKAVVYENTKVGTAYVVESRLKVMIEEDYLALQKGTGPGFTRALSPSAGSQIVREIIIPQLTIEVNKNKNFARLRQVYNSLILAAWYKKKIKDSILSQVYIDKNKVAGVNIDDPKEKEKIYKNYLKAFKKGAYNYIKEEQDPFSKQIIPRKYFSGGVQFGEALTAAMVSKGKLTRRQIGLLRRAGAVGLVVFLSALPFFARHLPVKPEEKKPALEAKAQKTPRPTQFLDLNSTSEDQRYILALAQKKLTDSSINEDLRLMTRFALEKTSERIGKIPPGSTMDIVRSLRLMGYSGVEEYADVMIKWFMASPIFNVNTIKKDIFFKNQEFSNELWEVLL
ncbi:MAG: hypothetical protein HQL13_05220, partial [Candidatus Omnitrophica bacterium]|nr:hypothetical protein [Candidatus Omnitrophota bacterium]